MSADDDVFDLQALAQLCLDGFPPITQVSRLQGFRAAALLEAWGVVTSDRPTPALKAGEDPEHFLDRTLLYLSKVAGDPRYSALTVPSSGHQPREEAP